MAVPKGKSIADAYVEEAEVDQFGLDIKAQTVEVTFTAVIEELTLGSGGRPLFHALLETIHTHAQNGVYEVPNFDGRNITVTVEGL